jgi:hypothetical protein
VTLTAGTLVAVLASAVAAQDVSVTLNGAPVALSPAPITRAGRVFVPLRGVFEKLGASVVYDSGTINAQGNGHSVSLHIGSNQATVDGTGQQLDVAPFIVGASTYVPLRFVSQALGAQVNYDASNKVVALVGGSGPPNQVITPVPRGPAPPPAAAPFNTIALADVRPGQGGSVRASRPEITGRFTAPVDTDTVKVELDGRDVSSSTYMNANQFAFTPPYDLPAQQHVVRVTGRARDGARFDRTWRFTTGSGIVANFLHDLRPENGANVGSSFRVTGATLPRSKVRVAASGSKSFNGILVVGTDTYTTDVTADESGNFVVDVPLRESAGTDVTLQVQSISPDGQSAATREALHIR